MTKSEALLLAIALGYPILAVLAVTWSKLPKR